MEKIEQMEALNKAARDRATLTAKALRLAEDIDRLKGKSISTNTLVTVTLDANSWVIDDVTAKEAVRALVLACYSVNLADVEAKL